VSLLIKEEKMNKINLDVQEEKNNQLDQNDPGTSTEAPKKRTAARGFNQQVGEAELLVEAMSANQELLAPGGGGEEFLNQLKGVVNDLKSLNLEQERYKALQRESTEKIRQKLKSMKNLVRKGRRIIKNEIEQKRWIEFGIRATR
jgi:hypothetical protein